jgi:luciferase family oxidoreductase group 1
MIPTSSGLQLGILDFGQFFAPQTPGDLMAATRRYAVLADELGYSRYWLAEHHEPSMAWANPELLVPMLAESTRRIRVGTAGILLYFYSPYRVAETFALLERLHPGRVDCGVAAGVSAPPVREALLPGFDVEHEHYAGTYGRKVGEMLGYLRADYPKGHRFSRGPVPIDTRVSSVWLLGLANGNRALASIHGTQFSYSIIHGATRQDPALIRAYRDEFKPSPELAAPSANIACSVICADSEEAALAQRDLYEQHTMGSMLVNACGTPEQCREQLLAIADKYQVEELVIMSFWHNLDRREASYRLLAGAMGLHP